MFLDDGTEIDVSPQVGVKAFATTVNLRDPDLYGGQTVEDETSAWANVRYDVRVIRVGKANTLLVVPNDWSTLSNGTLDGVPTGLHRYVGEQRFVFGLLNVTDGRGDLVSYDLETRKTLAQPFYADDSGNGLVGGFAGASLVPGYFGNGTRLSGSGSYVRATDDAKLNWINGSLTVAFWIRPDADYITGSGWNWSFGRQGLWRLGFYGPAQGLRFEVVQNVVPYTVHSAQATYPLYAGRWVHLAATMSTYGSYTNLSLYANGNLLAWKNETPSYGVRDSGTPGAPADSDLYLGYDAQSGGRLKGIVDEFRLYRAGLKQDSIRGLLWFRHGANNVIIPRGVLYESKLYGELKETSFDANAPFAGGTAYGNSNTLSSNLNSRVIQMVIAKNLTLAQAWGIIDLARTKNGTLDVTAFPFFATSGYYTLGFLSEVNSITANTSVVNGGNWSTPPPPPNLWQLFWNTIAGWAERAWNAVVAVGAFFESVGRWLKDAFIGIAYGLASGNWTYFQENVVNPLADAIRGAIDSLLALIRSAIDFFLRPIQDLLSSLKAQAWGVAVGFFNQIRVTHPGGEAGSHNTEQMAAWVSANAGAVAAPFLLATVAIYFLGLFVGAALQSNIIMGAAALLLVVGALAIAFAVTFPKPIMDAGATIAHTPEAAIDFAKGVHTSLGSGKYLISALLMAFAWRTAPWLSATPESSIWMAWYRAKLSLLFMAMALQQESTPGGNPCPSKVFGLMLAATAEVFLAKAVIDSLRSQYLPATRATLAVLTGTFLVLNTIVIFGSVGDLSLNCGR